MTDQRGEIVFTKLDRVIHGRPAAEAVVAEADRLGAERVFILSSRSLNRDTDEVATVTRALGGRFAGLCDHMPSHSPRDAVVDCANQAAEAGTDLLVTIGGGSVTDGGKAVTLCLKHGIRDMDGMEAFRTVVDEQGKRHFPDYTAPDVRQIVVPTTLSAGEFNARAGVTDPRHGLKQAYIHPGLIPAAIVLDPAITVATPEWLWLSTGIRAVDHAVETYLSLDANPYTDGAALHALKLLGEGLPATKRDPNDLAARRKCLFGAWLSMTGIVTGTRLGASHAIGHVLGGAANVPHGHTSCIMMPYVLAFNATVNGDRQKDIAAAMGRAGEAADQVLDRFIADLDQPRRLRDTGLGDNRLAEIAEKALLDDWTFSNPRPLKTAEDVMEILRAAY